jgi:hypothetical protein
MVKKAVKAKGKTPAQKATPSRTRAKWEQAFLAALREFGVIRAACEAAKIDRRAAYRHKEQTPRFAKEWDDALQDFADSLEAEAVRRARDGTIKGIYHLGVLMNTELQYSDTLMSQMLKAKRPDEYAEKLVIKLDPAHLALLAKLNMSPSDAWLMFIQELANADSSISASGG